MKIACCVSFFLSLNVNEVMLTKKEHELYEIMCM